MSVKKMAVGLALAGAFALVIALVGGSSPAQGQARDGLLLVQQDKVLQFNPFTGEGVQVGTATGKISGVSIVNFKFTIVDPSIPTISFDNRVGITDLDGDQIIFNNQGGGKFVFPPLIDPTASILFQVFGGTPLPCPGLGGTCSGVGGPLSGTYEVVATSGKYVERYPLGQKFPYRGVAYNPSSPPAQPTDLGAVYVEVAASPLP